MRQQTSFAVYPSLRERVVVVTGGGSGIGAEIVEQFARQGARVAFLDRDLEPAQDLVAALAGNGPTRSALPALPTSRRSRHCVRRSRESTRSSAP